MLTLLAASIPLVLGHWASGRVLQMLWMAAPVPLLLLLWPRPWLRAVASLWLLAFGLDACLRGFLFTRYGMTHESSALVTAVANTSATEAGEYLRGHAHDLLPWAGLALLAGTLPWLLRIPSAAMAPGRARQALWLLVAFMLLSTALKGMRRFHPLQAWPLFAWQVQAQQQEWLTLDQRHADWLARARAAVPRPAPAPTTAVLVISDSVHALNLQLYGYSRPTSPALASMRPSLTVVREAWAQDASTVPALNRLLVHGPPPQAQHLLALARAAGFRIWWLSNHDDLAVKSLHGRLAGTDLHLLNHTPGRRSDSSDAVVLPALREALADPAERKLIVLHLLGAHPYYERRFPPGQNPFAGHEDAVNTDLRKAGRSSGLLAQRDAYDAALLHHDRLLAETLTLTQTGPGLRAWVFVSDHGQEVGHESNHAGHSPTTAAGYRIPLLLWRSTGFEMDKARIEARPFRADGFTPLVADLLHIPWAQSPRSESLLHPAYVWRPPDELTFLGHRGPPPAMKP